MKTIFVDTNIILDVLLQNEGFWQDSLKVLRLAELGKVSVCASASSMTDIFYVTKKKLTTPVARDAIEKLLKLLVIVGVDGDDLQGALSLPIDDLEDALQVWCAKKVNADMLITRDTAGFANIDMPVVAPAEFTA